MRILFDQGTPVPLRRCLFGHVVATAYELGWSTVTNGDLIRLAEQEGYGLLITTDTNLRYQQNLKERTISILVLSTTSWPRIRQITERVQATIALINTGGYEELLVPSENCIAKYIRSIDRSNISQDLIPIEFKRLPQNQPQGSKKLLPVGSLRIHSWNLFDPPYGRCSSRSDPAGDRLSARLSGAQGQ